MGYTAFQVIYRMRKKVTLGILVLILSLAAVSAACAHQPRIVSGYKVVEIRNTDVSQAFYGELDGRPQEFILTLQDKPDLYLGLLVPDIANIKTDISLVLAGEGNEYVLDGLQYTWEYFYEEYAGDGYLQGPELTKALPRGKYTIKVYSPRNLGKYVLVVGKKEVFSPSEIWNMVKSLPYLKIKFFNKSVLHVFDGKVGKAELIIVVVIIGLFMLIVVRFRKRSRRAAIIK